MNSESFVLIMQTSLTISGLPRVRSAKYPQYMCLRYQNRLGVQTSHFTSGNKALKPAAFPYCHISYNFWGYILFLVIQSIIKLNVMHFFFFFFCICVLFVNLTNCITRWQMYIYSLQSTVLPSSTWAWSTQFWSKVKYCYKTNWG